MSTHRRLRIGEQTASNKKSKSASQTASPPIPKDDFFKRKLVLSQKKGFKEFLNPICCVRCKSSANQGRHFQNRQGMFFVCSECISSLLDSLTPELIWRCKGVPKYSLSVPEDIIISQLATLDKLPKSKKYKEVRFCVRCASESYEGRDIFVHPMFHFFCKDCVSVLKDKLIKFRQSNQTGPINTDHSDICDTRKPAVERPSIDYVRKYIRKNEGRRLTSSFICFHCNTLHSWGTEFNCGGYHVSLCEDCKFDLIHNRFTNVIYTPMGNRR